MQFNKSVAVVALAATMAACGGGSNTAEPPATTGASTYPPNGESTEVLALDNNFVVQDIEVVAGTEVVWNNKGRNPHNVLPEGDKVVTTWGVMETDFLPGATFSHVFDRPGTYTYYCSIHGTAKAGMFGTVTVTAP